VLGIRAYGCVYGVRYGVGCRVVCWCCVLVVCVGVVLMVCWWCVGGVLVCWCVDVVC
jgi:hypothetical protein